MQTLSQPQVAGSSAHEPGPNSREPSIAGSAGDNSPTHGAPKFPGAFASVLQGIYYLPVIYTILHEPNTPLAAAII